MPGATAKDRLLQRWQQAEDDELLYAVDPGYGTAEEAVHAAMAAFRRYAEAQQQDPSVIRSSAQQEPEA